MFTPKSVQQVQALREKYGEQHYQVEHYLALWKADKSKANWDRLLGAVEGYKAFTNADERHALLKSGKKVYSLNHQNRIERWTLGPRGGLYAATFGKGKSRWNQPHSCVPRLTYNS